MILIFDPFCLYFSRFIIIIIIAIVKTDAGFISITHQRLIQEFAMGRRIKDFSLVGAHGERGSASL